jgi:hypothetical protein
VDSVAVRSTILDVAGDNDARLIVAYDGAIATSMARACR